MLLRINSGTMPKRIVVLPWTVALLFSVLFFNNQAYPADAQETAPPQQEEMSDETASEEEVINVRHADRFEQREKEGLTIFTGNVQIERPDGFLNADKVTIYENVETNETVKTVAEGNVELRDGDTFVTCAHAILNHLTDIIDFSDNVIVLQNEDRLEADTFRYNRRTGERSGEGNIKVRFRVKSQEESEADSEADSQEAEADLQEADADSEDEEEAETSGGSSNP